MEMKNLLVVFAVCQVASAQDLCDGLNLNLPLGPLLGNTPISTCSPSLPPLPYLPYGGCSSYPSALPTLPTLPTLTGLGDYGCSSLPSLPSLPELDACDDYPYFPEPLPYKKKKLCTIKAIPCHKPKLCGCQKPCGLKECGCGLKECGCELKECGCEDKLDTGIGFKIHPLIKPFKLKKKCDDFGGITDLPYHLPSLVSNAFGGFGGFGNYGGCL